MKKHFLVISLAVILIIENTLPLVAGENKAVFIPDSGAVNIASSKSFLDFRKKKKNIPEEKRLRYIKAGNLKATKLEIEDYTLEVDDLLVINVWQIPELQLDNVVVRPDGKISFPLIGDVQAEGKTIEQLRKDITDKLKLYIKAPQVTVMILEFGGKTAVILQEGGGGGLIRFTRPITVMEALSLGGGISTESDTDRIFVIRDSYTDQPTIIVVNATSIYQRANISENILIRSGDIIYIPRSIIHDLKFFMDTLFGPIYDYVEKYYGGTSGMNRRKWRFSIRKPKDNESRLDTP